MPLVAVEPVAVEPLAVHAYVTAAADTVADAESQLLVKRYLALHDNPSAEGIAALFTPDFEVIGSGPHAGGFRGEAYLQFLLAKKGTRFTQDAGSTVQRSADGRLVLRWTLRHGEQVLARGIDYLTLADGKIQKIVGVY